MIKKESFLAMIGKWTNIDGMIGLVNVYGPREVKKRKEAWKKLEMLVSKEEIKWCIFWDFNEVRGEHERLNTVTNSHGVDDFNDFIRRSNLLEVPMGGKKFTRISDDGLKFSKLDRFLVTNEFCMSWRNVGVKALERKWSDHAPIMLYEDRTDFGLKPFKFFDTRLKEEGME